MASPAINREIPRDKNWWPRKKRQSLNQNYPKLDRAWINEFVGDERIFRDKPSAWSSGPQIGMDKIRATTNVGKYFVNFASSSTIHGLNHLAAPHRHPFERFLCCLFIGGALVSLILLSLNFWDRYQNEAVISIIDNNYRNLTITKPAAFVCPLIKYEEESFKLACERNGIQYTTEARQFFSFLANATYQDFTNTPIYDAVSPDKWLKILFESKRHVSTNDDHTSTSWIVTEVGFCLYFYSVVGIYSSYEYWAANNWTIVPIPEELPSYTYKQREQVQSLNVLTDSITMSPEYPIDIPNFFEIGVRAEVGHLVSIETIPKEIKTSEAVKSLSVHQRKCKIPDDGGLKMWPIYAYGMCRLECKYKMMLEKCGCHPHFARPMPGIPICTALQLRCIGKNHREFTKTYNNAGKICGCLQNCDKVTYDTHPPSDTELKAGSPLDAVLNLRVDFPMEIIRREVLFGFIDFLISVGGAAGLFLGASVISFVEIFYYATLRLFWYRVQIRKEKENRLGMKQITAQRNNKNNVVIKY